MQYTLALAIVVVVVWYGSHVISYNLGSCAWNAFVRSFPKTTSWYIFSLFANVTSVLTKYTACAVWVCRQKVFFFLLFFGSFSDRIRFSRISHTSSYVFYSFLSFTSPSIPICTRLSPLNFGRVVESLPQMYAFNIFLLDCVCECVCVSVWRRI